MQLSESTSLNNVIKGTNRYTQGGLSDYYDVRVGWWERNVFERDATDIIFYVDNNNEFRPDLISYAVYNSPRYTWLVLQYNNIVDINEELVNGTRLLLPSTGRLTNSILTNPIIGKKIESNV